MSDRTYLADRLLNGGYARSIEVRAGELVYVLFMNDRRASIRIERDDYQVWCEDDGLADLASHLVEVEPDEDDVLHLTGDQCWTLLSAWADRRTRVRPYWA